MYLLRPFEVRTRWRAARPDAAHLHLDAEMAGARVGSARCVFDAALSALCIERVEIDPALGGSNLHQTLILRLYEQLQRERPGAALSAQVTPARASELRRSLPDALMGEDPELPKPVAHALLAQARRMKPTSEDELLLALCSVAARRLARWAGRVEAWCPEAAMFKGMGFRQTRALRSVDWKGPGCGVRLELQLGAPPSPRAMPSCDSPRWNLLPAW